LGLKVDDEKTGRLDEYGRRSTITGIQIEPHKRWKQETVSQELRCDAELNFLEIEEYYQQSTLPLPPSARTLALRTLTFTEGPHLEC
jgi:hypothetical protein